MLFAPLNLSFCVSLVRIDLLLPSSNLIFASLVIYSCLVVVNLSIFDLYLQCLPPTAHQHIVAFSRCRDHILTPMKQIYDFAIGCSLIKSAY